MRFIIVILALLLCPIALIHGQKGKKGKMDSVRVKGKTILILGDSSVYIERDTVLMMPDSVATKLQRDEVRRSDEFYDRIKQRFSKTRFTRELYDLLFEDSGRGQRKPVTKEPLVNGNYRRFEGKIVRKIYIKNLKPFGTSIRDTNRHSDAWSIKVANKVHVPTKDRIIKNNIFFKEGDEVNADLFQDSERILRQLSFIKDARVIILPVKSSRYVDVLIIVKDVWSVSVEFDFDSFDDFDFSLVDRNFLGYGQEFRNDFLYDVNNTPKVGYGGTYRIVNIYNTFITGEVNFARSQPLDRIGFRVFRNFITPETKYAGGVEISKENREFIRVYPDTTISFHSEFNNTDLWFGRSFMMKQDNGGARQNFQVASRYQKLNFFDRPFVSEDTNQFFLDRQFYLFSAGFSSREYEESGLISGFGRTEDIPKGYLLEATFGKERNELYKRNYFGARLALGNYYERVGYVRPSIAIGGFFKGRTVEQGIVKMDLSYFSYLYRVRRFSFRHFIKLGYVIGIDRFDNEFININNGNGIRGLSYTFLRGTRKITLSSETVAFTPYYFLGFRFATYLFLDFGIVNDENKRLLKNSLYQGYGIGIRLRNENLAFKTVQIRFAYYPVVPPGNDNFNFDLTGDTTFRLPDFRVEKPTVVSFE